MKNFFNLAVWDAILEAQDRNTIPGHVLKIVRDYFKDRLVLYGTEAGRRSYAVTAGVPQSSVVEHILWNVMFDGVLRLRLPIGAQIIGLLDDIALVVRGKYHKELVRTCNHAVRIERSWIKGIGLELNDHRIDVLLVNSTKKIEFITITVIEKHRNFLLST